MVQVVLVIQLTVVMPYADNQFKMTMSDLVMAVCSGQSKLTVIIVYLMHLVFTNVGNT